MRYLGMGLTVLMGVVISGCASVGQTAGGGVGVNGEVREMEADGPTEGSEVMAASGEPARDRTKDAAAGERYVPWRERQGPAYPGDYWRSVGRDSKEFGGRVWDDTQATVGNPVSVVSLLAAGAAGIALQGPNADERIQEHYDKRGHQLNSFWDSVGDAGGNPGTHFALAGAMYFASLAEQDNKTYESSKTLLRALALNGMTTLMLKGATRTESPNGNENGWPSGHTSSTFALATVMWHEHGPWLGVPLMGFASYVGYERIDAQNHDFSDVISGALIGFAIGQAVTENEQMRVGEFVVSPYVDGENGRVGLALCRTW